METIENHENHVAVAVRDDAPGRLALQWALEEYGRGAAAQDVLFTLLHVVSDVPNARKLSYLRKTARKLSTHAGGNADMDVGYPYLPLIGPLCNRTVATNHLFLDFYTTGLLCDQGLAARNIIAEYIFEAHCMYRTVREVTLQFDTGVCCTRGVTALRHSPS